jgi:hypothetical protein
MVVKKYNTMQSRLMSRTSLLRHAIRDVLTIPNLVNTVKECQFRKSTLTAVIEARKRWWNHPAPKEAISDPMPL